MKTLKMLRGTYERLQRDKKALEESLIHVINDVNVARERGDLRENAEYNAAKSTKIDLERNLSNINQKLLRASIVENIVLKDFITFGNTVVLEDLKNKIEFTYVVLGEEEADIGQGKISCDSILGYNLLGKRKDEKFIFQTPGGAKEFLVKNFYIDDKL
jgi:transcription elongation factor GreA